MILIALLHLFPEDPKDKGFSKEHYGIGTKGVGEIGLVGIAAAIANAVFHATGHRIRSLPITLEHML